MDSWPSAGKAMVSVISSHSLWYLHAPFSKSGISNEWRSSHLPDNLCQICRHGMQGKHGTRRSLGASADIDSDTDMNEGSRGDMAGSGFDKRCARSSGANKPVRNRLVTFAPQHSNLRTASDHITHHFAVRRQQSLVEDVQIQRGDCRCDEGMVLEH